MAARRTLKARRSKPAGSRTRFASVTDYLQSLDPRAAGVVRRIRTLVRKSVPGCRETIGYNIPAFVLDKPFMYCAAFKSHVGIYPPVRADAMLMKKLARYANAKGNLRFPLKDPVPYTLIARVARALAKQYAAG